jgi:NADH-quinone oxidoreductase subunit L
MSTTLNENLLLAVPLAPLAGSLIAGLFGKAVGRAGAHTVTILGVAISFILSAIVFLDVLNGASFNATIYEWMEVGKLKFEIGFLVDSLTALMMCVVTFVSLMVHIYTIGYMADDDGYQRFFSYIALFTFSMLMLVMSNNLLQLFFGWEAVGLVSYLLIGFYFTRESAIYANMKAFIVNRVGDFGFLLGIGLLLAYAGSLNYGDIFSKSHELAAMNFPGTSWGLLTVACICLFIGAMGKSAQFPLHVWLPDSMEGPTPISALIHAATMVTAGIFMVTRMSPLFELSDSALSFVTVIGAITALFMGFLGIVQNDIKRVVAYSTLSQLGYMTVALGVSAYPVAMFHLMTHAFLLGDHRHAPRSGHAQHGWPAQIHADHVDHVADRFAGADRYAVLLGLLLERLDHRCSEAVASAGFGFRVLRGGGERVRHCAVFVPYVLPRVPR